MYYKLGKNSDNDEFIDQIKSEESKKILKEIRDYVSEEQRSIIDIHKFISVDKSYNISGGNVTVLIEFIVENKTTDTRIFSMKEDQDYSGHLQIIPHEFQLEKNQSQKVTVISSYTKRRAYDFVLTIQSNSFYLRAPEPQCTYLLLVRIQVS